MSTCGIQGVCGDGLLTEGMMGRRRSESPGCVTSRKRGLVSARLEMRGSVGASRCRFPGTPSENGMANSKSRQAIEPQESRSFSVESLSST